MAEPQEQYRMKAAKLKPDLKVQLTEAAATEVLDVVLELRSQAEPVAAAPQSRSEQIALRKEAFSHDVVPVEEAVHEVGGEVLDRAWINQTVRARVPAEGVEQLSELDQVETLDIPRRLEADFG
jgi:hypothetical protein